VKSVAVGHVPAVDADFAKAFGIASGAVDQLKAEIASNLELELKRKIEAKLKEQVFAALRGKAKFALPRSLVELEAQNMARRMAADLQQQGMKPDDIKVSPEMFRANAEGRVALGLVLAEVVRTQGLQPRPEQVKALVQESAQTYEQPDAVVRWHYDKPERLNEFETMAVERNVVDWFLQRVAVEDLVPWNSPSGAGSSVTLIGKATPGAGAAGASHRRRPVSRCPSRTVGDRRYTTSPPTTCSEPPAPRPKPPRADRRSASPLRLPLQFRQDNP
jgi:FKBP-type peptidyl-prolyl cis-trans isomerase (trigger factor)